MLETTETLLPGLSEKAKKLSVVSVGFDENGLDEFERLLTTLGVKTASKEIVAIRRINPATYIGRGKLDEIKQLLTDLQAEAVIFDVELSPNQLRNLEKEIGKPILDRPGVIIRDFFAACSHQRGQNAGGACPA